MFTLSFYYSYMVPYRFIPVFTLSWSLLVYYSFRPYVLFQKCFPHPELNPESPICLKSFRSFMVVPFLVVHGSVTPYLLFFLSITSFL